VRGRPVPRYGRSRGNRQVPRSSTVARAPDSAKAAIIRCRRGVAALRASCRG
jgi:hypothetical protein